jgi:3-oxoacyl-[acyl-carrier-protein] synthase-3
MNGQQVKRYVLANLPPLIHRACALAGFLIGDIAAFVCHQANVKLLHQLAALLDVDPSLMPLTAPEYGNTGAASVPLTLLAADAAGMLVPGRPVVLCGVGGGMSVAAGVYVP